MTDVLVMNAATQDGYTRFFDFVPRKDDLILMDDEWLRVLNVFHYPSSMRGTDPITMALVIPEPIKDSSYCWIASAMQINAIASSTPTPSPIPQPQPVAIAPTTDDVTASDALDSLLEV